MSNATLEQNASVWCRRLGVTLSADADRREQLVRNAGVNPDSRRAGVLVACVNAMRSKGIVGDRNFPVALIAAKAIYNMSYVADKGFNVVQYTTAQIVKSGFEVTLAEIIVIQELAVLGIQNRVSEYNSQPAPVGVKMANAILMKGRHN